MSFLETMHTYFRGEKVEALYFIVPLSLAMLALAAVTIKVERGGFAWGLAIPIGLMGVFLLVVGITVVKEAGERQSSFPTQYADSPESLVDEELERMTGVAKLFRTTYVAFGVAAGVGLILLFGLRSDWARGLGTALVLLGGLGFTIDGFAERRTEPYIEVLETLASQQRPAIS